MYTARSRSRQGGFTLVEMAVVLVIIGVIIGAVMIGRDVQRNAEYNRIKQKFVDQWVVGYNTFHQRYGAPVGDNQAAPQLMVNGAHFASGFSGGDMTSVTEPAVICAGNDPLATTTGYSRTKEGEAAYDLRAIMKRAGISMPPGRGEGKEDRYAYLDTNGNPQEVRVCFAWNKPGTNWGSGNVMVVSGLTPDLARALDQMIDGKADAANGAFRQAGVTRSNPTGANSPTQASQIGVEWGGNNTGSATSTVTTGQTFGSATDDDQVMTVIANYKMNQ